MVDGDARAGHGCPIAVSRLNSVSDGEWLSGTRVCPSVTDAEASEAPATERAGNRYAEPITTASHLDSTLTAIRCTGSWANQAVPVAVPDRPAKRLGLKAVLLVLFNTPNFHFLGRLIR